VLAIRKNVQEVYHVESLYEHDRINKKKAIFLFVIFCTILAFFAPIGFVCLVAFLEAVIKKLEKLDKECFIMHINEQRKDFNAFVDWFAVYIGLIKEKCVLDASLFNVST
jgi:hypothetical protein